jgi:hypothetical protein
MDVVIFYMWMSVSDYNTNPTVIILVVGWNLNEMHVLFIYLLISG